MTLKDEAPYPALLILSNLSFNLKILCKLKIAEDENKFTHFYNIHLIGYNLNGSHRVKCRTL